MNPIKLSPEILGVAGLTFVCILAVKGVFIDWWSQTAENLDAHQQLESMLEDPAWLESQVEIVAIRIDAAKRLLDKQTVPLPDSSHAWTQWICRLTRENGLALERIYADEQQAGWSIQVTGSTESMISWLAEMEVGLPPGSLKSLTISREPTQTLELFVAWESP